MPDIPDIEEENKIEEDTSKPEEEKDVEEEEEQEEEETSVVFHFRGQKDEHGKARGSRCGQPLDRKTHKLGKVWNDVTCEECLSHRKRYKRTRDEIEAGKPPPKKRKRQKVLKKLSPEELKALKEETGEFCDKVVRNLISMTCAMMGKSDVSRMPEADRFLGSLEHFLVKRQIRVLSEGSMLALSGVALGVAIWKSPKVNKKDSKKEEKEKGEDSGGES